MAVMAPLHPTGGVAAASIRSATHRPARVDSSPAKLVPGLPRLCVLFVEPGCVSVLRHVIRNRTEQLCFVCCAEKFSRSDSLSTSACSRHPLIRIHYSMFGFVTSTSSPLGLRFSSFHSNTITCFHHVSSGKNQFGGTCRTANGAPARLGSRRLAPPRVLRTLNCSTMDLTAPVTSSGNNSIGDHSAQGRLTPLVPILMGSKADKKHCDQIAAACHRFGLATEMHVLSAHKVPTRLLEVVGRLEADPRPKVYISVAGRSNALSGLLDGSVASPVIACPPPSDAFGGADIFSSLRMPGGIAPVVSLDPGNAALTAAKILGIHDPLVRDRVRAFQKANRDRLYVDDAEVATSAYLADIQAAARENNVLVSTDGVLSALVQQHAGTWRKKQGKVRDQFYSDAAKHMILVTTDRQSAFDRVLAAVPFKGAVLNLVSAWWFRRTEHIVPNHLIAVPHPNVTIAKRCDPFPIEFVVRGYATGSTSTSLWKNYERGVREYCGIKLPDNLHKNQKLWMNLVTPTTKEDIGDALISRQEIIDRGLMSAVDFDACAAYALRLFEYGQQVASEHGLILVDTKYEFGRDADGQICLIDEIHTPDSSRYWLATSYEERIASGKEPENIDKEILRLWYRDHCDPYKDEKLPEAPLELVTELSRRYIQLYEMITWDKFDLRLSTPSELQQALGPWFSGQGAKANFTMSSP
jgi:phosphoribosylaminoimidazole-succinocarboxamide synthase